MNLSLKTIHTQNTQTEEHDDQIGQIFTVTLSLHHLVALVRQDDILRHMLKSKYTIGKWDNPVSVNHDDLKVII